VRRSTPAIRRNCFDNVTVCNILMMFVNLFVMIQHYGETVAEPGVMKLSCYRFLSVVYDLAINLID